MNCNAICLGIIFLTMSINPALLQKILEDWFRLPELFAGLPDTGNFLLF